MELLYLFLCFIFDRSATFYLYHYNQAAAAITLGHDPIILPMPPPPRPLLQLLRHTNTRTYYTINILLYRSVSMCLSADNKCITHPVILNRKHQPHPPLQCPL